jgi:phage terminase large subunit-like protein
MAKIIDINSFEVGKEKWLGNDNYCNRYLRLDENTIEVEHVYRFGKSPPVKVYTAEEFAEWRRYINAV